MLEDGLERAEATKGTYCAHKEDGRCCFTAKKTIDDSELFCCRCSHKRRASPLTCLAICFLVLTYNLLGGFLFLALEGTASNAEETAVAASMPDLGQSQGVSHDLRTKTVEKLWSITEDLNILYKENWTKLAAKELMDFQKVLIKTIRGGVIHESRVLGEQRSQRWTFSNSFLYALTLITTIGHGNITPKSTVGRMVAIAYSCIGIPIIMVYLSTLGEALARHFRALYSRLCPTRALRHARNTCYQHAPEARNDRKRTPFQAALNLDGFNGGYHWTCRDHTRVPIVLSLCLIAVYIALGTVVFHKTEKWSLIDGCYFSFSSLATIGLGELRPGLYASTISAKSEDVAVGVCCIYILVGIVVVAMCFNLIQEDLGSALRSFTALCSGGAKSRVIHTEKPCEERIAMSLVS